MRRPESMPSESWQAVVLLSALLLVACPGVDNPLGIGFNEYGVNWVFVNQSNVTVLFEGSDINGSNTGDYRTPRIPVDPGATGSYRSGGGTEETTTSISVRVYSLINNVTPVHFAGPLETGVADGQDITVTATWDGTALSLSAVPACSPPAVAAPTSRAAVCTPSTTWRLDGITGNASANWLDIAATATGTLTLTVPQEVTPGQSYPVSATFSGSITVNPGWAGYATNLTIGIIDRVTFGVNVNNSQFTGALAVGTFARSITVNGSWVVPSNPASLVLEAGGGWTMGGPGNANPPNLIATYSRAP